MFFGVAQRAALPMLIHPSQRSLAVSQNEARQNAAQLAGPALGGALFGLSRAAPFAADALSYLASLVTLPFIKAPMQAASSAPELRRLRAELGEGLAFSWRQPFLRYSAFFAASVNILLQVLTLGLIVLARHDGASSAQIGLIVGCMGAGGLAGAFAAPWVQRRIPAGITITGCMWTWAVLLTLIVLVRVPLWLCPIVAVLGFVGPAWNVSVQTYRMQITPNELLGRTSSVALQVGGEGGQVEQVEQRVAPPLPRRPVVEMPQALVGRVQDRPQHRAVVAARIGSLLAGAYRRYRYLGIGRSWLAVQDRRRLLGHGQAERPG